MKRKTFLIVLLVAASMLISAGVGFAAPSPTPWTGNGPGALTIVDGTTSNPQFSYDYHHNRAWSGDWDFHTVADSDEAVSLHYNYSGFHAWYKVTVYLQAYVTRNNATTYYFLEGDGPVNCCAPPSGSFSYSGNVTLNVEAGDTYGFVFGGSNYDDDDTLLGTLAVDDTDGDGVRDGIDYCPATAIPESVPTVELKSNNWALVDDDNVFDTVSQGNGKGPGRSYTTADTGGCSCEQIIAAQGLGNGHTKHGCSIGAMDNWIASLP